MRLTGNGDGFPAPANAEERNNKMAGGATNTPARFTGAKEPMNSTIVMPHEHAVKHQRFVAATEADQEQFERELGRNLYKRGKPLRECRTDYMAAGWLAAERKGADDYYRSMMRQASAVKAVNWNSDADGGW